METVFVLLPFALIIAAIAVGFFIWAARAGPFAALETPAVRIHFDDEDPRPRAANVSAAPVRPGVVGVDAASANDAKAETRRVLQ